MLWRSMNPDYTTITERPGGKILPIQLQRLYQRYKFATQYCQNKDVLEVACGSGSGLALLSRFARSVKGGDIEDGNLKVAQETYHDTPDIALFKLDAHHLTFDDNSFDVILLYEALYYLKEPACFLKESHRVLRDQGTVIICTANKDWPDFNPSPFSHKYFSVPELKDLFEAHGFSVHFFAAFPDHKKSATDQIKSFIKRLAIKLHLMPKTMAGKAKLKRLFFGKLTTYPRKLHNGLTDYIEPVAIPANQPDNIHTAIFAVATRQSINESK